MNFRKGLFFLLIVFSVSFVVAENCTNECEQILDTRCYANNTGYSICTDVDMDGCLEWKEEFVCAEGLTCSDGACVNGSGLDVSGVDGSSGGSGGSGCTTTWNCSDWGECDKGSQLRSCSKVRVSCGAPSKPAEMKACSSSEGEDDGDDEEDVGLLAGLFGGDDSEEGGFFSGSLFYWIGGGVVILLIVGLVLWLILRKKGDSLDGASGDSLVMEINRLLGEGDVFLRQGNIVEAKNHYKIIKGKFRGVGSSGGDLFVRIKDFFNRIVIAGRSR